MSKRPRREPGHEPSNSATTSLLALPASLQLCILKFGSSLELAQLASVHSSFREKIEHVVRQRISPQILQAIRMSWSRVCQYQERIEAAGHQIATIPSLAPSDVSLAAISRNKPDRVAAIAAAAHCAKNAQERAHVCKAMRAMLTKSYFLKSLTNHHRASTSMQLHDHGLVPWLMGAMDEDSNNKNAWHVLKIMLGALPVPCMQPEWSERMVAQLLLAVPDARKPDDMENPGSELELLAHLSRPLNPHQRIRDLILETQQDDDNHRDAPVASTCATLVIDTPRCLDVIVMCATMQEGTVYPQAIQLLAHIANGPMVHHARVLAATRNSCVTLLGCAPVPHHLYELAVALACRAPAFATRILDSARILHALGYVQNRQQSETQHWPRIRLLTACLTVVQPNVPDKAVIRCLDTLQNALTSSSRPLSPYIGDLMRAVLETCRDDQSKTVFCKPGHPANLLGSLCEGFLCAETARCLGILGCTPDAVTHMCNAEVVKQLTTVLASAICVSDLVVQAATTLCTMVAVAGIKDLVYMAGHELLIEQLARTIGLPSSPHVVVDDTFGTTICRTVSRLVVVAEQYYRHVQRIVQLAPDAWVTMVLVEHAESTQEDLDGEWTNVVRAIGALLHHRPLEHVSKNRGLWSRASALVNTMLAAAVAAGTAGPEVERNPSNCEPRDGNRRGGNRLDAGCVVAAWIAPGLSRKDANTTLHALGTVVVTMADLRLELGPGLVALRVLSHRVQVTRAPGDDLDTPMHSHILTMLCSVATMGNASSPLVVDAMATLVALAHGHPTHAKALARIPHIFELLTARMVGHDDALELIHALLHGHRVHVAIAAQTAPALPFILRALTTTNPVRAPLAHAVIDILGLDGLEFHVARAFDTTPMPTGVCDLIAEYARGLRGTLVYTHQLDPKDIWDLAALPDGRVVVACHGGLVKVFRVGPERMEALWHPGGGAEVQGSDEEQVARVIVLPNGHVAVSHDEDIHILAVHPTTGQVTRITPHHPLLGHRNLIAAMSVLPNGQLASSDTHGEIRIWKIGSEGWCCMSTHQTNNSGLAVYALAALPCGKLIYAVGWEPGKDASVNTLDPATRKIETLWSGAEATSLTVLTENRLAGTFTDGNIRIWSLGKDASSVSLLSHIKGHTEKHAERINTSTSLPDGRLVTAADDKTVRVWNTGSSTISAPPDHVLHGHMDDVIMLDVLPDGRLVSGSVNGELSVWA